MENLKPMIKDASNQFECHNFEQALSLYGLCIERCLRQKLPKYLLYNLKSSQAALRIILGQHDAALEGLNSVLAEDGQHWLSLLRRCQLYKKQYQYGKALKDVEVLTMFAPDNIEVTALRCELKSLMKNGRGELAVSSEESQEELQMQKLDEVKALKFAKLKKIDRTSVSIIISKDKKKNKVNNRVSISGDSTFFYQSTTDDNLPFRQSKYFTTARNCQRYIEIQKQLQDAHVSKDKQNDSTVNIKVKPSRNKSILNNRNLQIYKVSKLPQETKNQQKKLIEKIRNIDSHIVESSKAISKSCNPKQVQFRKSSFINLQNLNLTKSQQGRKSCLKNSLTSKISHNENVYKNRKQERQSKFQIVVRDSIQAKLLKTKRKQSYDVVNQNSRQQNHGETESSESGSQFNIFGSKKVIINKELRENLGLGSESMVEDNDSKDYGKKNRGKIQKKNQKTSLFYS